MAAYITVMVTPATRRDNNTYKLIGVKMKRHSLITFLLTVMLFAATASASDVQFKADSAVADILFEYYGSEQYASYAVSEDGFVDITFASNIPDDLYSEILGRLKKHEDIDGVLAGSSGPACSLF